MPKKVFSPLLPAGIQDFFDPKADIKEAINTDAVIMKDTSGNKKWSIKHNTNIVKYDHYSPEPDNKMLNSGFESDLSSWSEVPSYTLNDQFTTDRAAGAVNGTSAEPTGGTRTVVDTENKLSISSSQLSFAGGKTSPAWADPQITYPSVSRVAGKMLIGKINPSNTSADVQIGFNRYASGNVSDAGTIYFSAGGMIRNYDSVIPIVGAYSGATDYYTAIVLRGTGAYYFIRGGAFTNWTLLNITQVSNTATLYPNVQLYNGISTADNIRIPTSTWLPTPLAYDTFTRADGAISNSETTGPDSQTTPSLAWTGGAISSNTNVITPSLGSELVVNGGFDADTDWTKTGGWSIGSGVASIITTDGNITQNIATIGQWYQLTWDVPSFTSGLVKGTFGAGSNLGYSYTSSGNGKINTGRQASDGYIGIRWNATPNGSIDDVSVKALTLSSLFSTVSTSDADVIADADVTLTAGTQAGLVLNLDSTSSPANFIIVYHDGTNVKVDEAVSGVYTNKQSTAVTYSAGATLRAIREGTKLRVYYNNALVGSELTMTANTNTKHGLFSTYASNTFDNFTLWPRGSGTTKFTDAPFEELTATRDTGTKYAGSASAKLVAGGVNGTYLQSVNVGDTVSYTLIAYAYTTGAAVTSADVELYYDTAVLSTSYTDMGSGWYKLTGTLTGVASAKNYGVYVKAGKTVYIDTVSLQAGVGATIEVTFENSSSGSSNFTFEGDITVGTETLTEANVTALKALI